jgi:hypothetical protein
MGLYCTKKGVILSTEQFYTLQMDNYRYRYLTVYSYIKVKRSIEW